MTGQDERPELSRQHASFTSLHIVLAILPVCLYYLVVTDAEQLLCCAVVVTVQVAV